LWVAEMTWQRAWNPGWIWAGRWGRDELSLMTRSDCIVLERDVKMQRRLFEIYFLRADWQKAAVFVFTSAWASDGPGTAGIGIE